MKRLLSIFIFSCSLIIVAFLLFGGIENWIEVNLNSARSTFIYAAVSFCIMVSDIIIPVPSSLVMILNGKVLGVLAGTLLSLTAGLLSSSIGFFIGRKINPYFDKYFTKQDKEISSRLFNSFGNYAIPISKAFPILSEAVSFVAGTTSITYSSFLLYSFIGHLIVSFIYAYVGSFSTSLDSNLFAALVIISALLVSWLAQIIIRKSGPAAS